MYVIRNQQTGLFWGDDGEWSLLSAARHYAAPAAFLIQPAMRESDAQPEFVEMGCAECRLVDTTHSELYDLYLRGQDELVIDLLATDHPGLVAGFLAQGIADGKIDQSRLNTIANKLIERRQEAFRAAGMLE